MSSGPAYANKVSAEALPTPVAYPSGNEVGRVLYEACVLEVTVHSTADESDCIVRFEDLVGFRLLDERELCEYWPVCSIPSGRLFEVTAGGWLSREVQRTPIRLFFPNAREYLVAGINECVSVIATCAPSVHLKPSQG